MRYINCIRSFLNGFWIRVRDLLCIVGDFNFPTIKWICDTHCDTGNVTRTVEWEFYPMTECFGLAFCNSYDV